MNCRRCNTPIPSRSSSCPNCGQHVGSGEAFIDDPGDSGVEAEAQSGGLMSPSPLASAEPDEVEVDLDDAVEVDLDDEVANSEAEELSLDEAVAPAKPAPRPVVKPVVKPTAKPTVKPAARPPVTVERPIAAQSRSATSGEPNRARKSAPPSSAPGVRSKGDARPVSPIASAMPTPTLPDAATVRAILAEHPELIEAGLTVLADETGREIGVHHATEVGVIDLLARDENGALVAVMVTASDSSGDLVGEALHRLGWVRKHLAKNGENVRGIVLTDHFDDDMAYAAAAVAGTLRFKSYALSLSLSDIDV